MKPGLSPSKIVPLLLLALLALAAARCTSAGPQPGTLAPATGAATGRPAATATSIPAPTRSLAAEAGESARIAEPSPTETLAAQVEPTETTGEKTASGPDAETPPPLPTETAEAGNGPDGSSPAGEAAAEPTPASGDGQAGDDGTANLGAAALAGCSDSAIFVDDVTIPDNTLVQQGESFRKTWRVRNSGDCDWTEGYMLAFDGGENMNGALTSPLPLTPAGEEADISIDLAAPSRGGPSTGYWAFRNADGQRFGVGYPPQSSLWVTIAVQFYTGDLPTPEAPVVVPYDPGEEVPADPVDDRRPPRAGQAVASACAVSRDESMEDGVLQMINDARRSAGLQTLTFRGALSEAAYRHVVDMACNHHTNHSGSDGSTYYDRIADTGYAYSKANENIFYGNRGFDNPSDAYGFWFNSAIHFKSMFDPNAGSIGIAYIFAPASDYGGYYTAVFTRP